MKALRQDGGGVRKRSAAAAAGLLFLLVPFVAPADVGSACETEATSLCPATRGRDRILCLEESQDELSDACRDALAAERGRMLMGRAPAAGVPRLGQACREDFTTHCGHLPSGTHRDEIVSCLKSHSESLSPGCMAALVAPEEDRETAAPPPGAGGFGGRGGFLGDGRRGAGF